MAPVKVIKDWKDSPYNRGFAARGPVASWTGNASGHLSRKASAMVAV